jgi:hypothetical protein
MVTIEYCSVIVHGNSRDKVPVPGGSDVFIFIALKVSVNSAIREVEAQGLIYR